jgi:protocatechuate 3,4-dioxygenase beta subunit
VGAVIQSITGPHADGGFIQLDKRSSSYSLVVRDADIREVVEMLAAESGMSIEVDHRLQGRVSVTLKDAKLDELLAELIDSSAFVYERDGDTYRLISASLASKAEKTDVEPLEEIPSRTAAETAWMKERHVLANSDKSVKYLLRKHSPAILLQNALIDTDPRLGADAVLVVPEAYRNDDTAYRIVQFDHAVTAADRQALEEAGAELSHYVPNHAYAVHADAETLEKIEGLDGIQHVEPYHPYYKMSGDVLDYMLGTADDVTMKRAEAGELNIMGFKGAGMKELAEGLGLEVLREQSSADRDVLTVKGSVDALDELVASEGVQWIEFRERARPMNDLGADRVRATNLKSLHPDLGLSGKGVTINVTDTGIDYINPGFAVNQNLATSTNVNTRIAGYYYRSGPYTEGLPGDIEGHGTHVAGTILGNGALSETVFEAPGSGQAPYATNQFAGVAPAAKVVMIEDFNSYTDEEQAELAYEKGARLSNNSWGNSVYEYGTMCAVWDELVRDADPDTDGNQEYAVFFSAGNSGNAENDGTGGSAGTIGQPGSAKNVITVGAVEQPRLADNLNGFFVGSEQIQSVRETDSDWEVSSFSSRGPVTPTDLRVKPDIMAPGNYVLSIQSHETMPDLYKYAGDLNWDYRYGNVDSGTNFAFLSGTSMACPMSVGASALLYEYYTNTFGRPPSPAMLKAMLVNGASMLNSLVYNYPNQSYNLTRVDQGWGMVDVVRSVDGPRVQDSDQVIFLDQDDTTGLETDDSFSYQVEIGENEGGLKVTLVWTEPPGTPGNAVQMVNDIDLLVFAPGGGGYAGNYFSSDGVHSELLPTADPALADAFNNVENIVIPSGRPGTYTIRVYAWEVADGPQDFALVITKGIGLQGRTAGENPDMTIDEDDNPVVAYSYDASIDGNTSNLTRQVYVKRWKGQVGDLSDLGTWRKMEDQWFEIDGSGTGNGISLSLQNSDQPSLDVDGERIFVAWEEWPQDTSTDLVHHIWFRYYDGTNWLELGQSARNEGISDNMEYTAIKPIVQTGADGWPFVAWQQRVSPAQERIFLTKWDGTNWIGFANSHTSGVQGGVEASNATMIVGADGNPIVAWEEGSTERIRVARWTGGSWANLGDVGFIPGAHMPDLTLGREGYPYLAWVQDPNNTGIRTSKQVYAMYYDGGSWEHMGDSINYPAVSGITNANMDPYQPQISVTFNTNVFVAWRSGEGTNRVMLAKRWATGTTPWLDAADGGKWPGLTGYPGAYEDPQLVVDSVGVPSLVFESYLPQVARSEIATYSIVGDREAPVFDGLQTAQGGTNGNVTLSWTEASDQVSTNIIYRIYQSTQSWPCGVTPSCSAADVFSNEIARVTNTDTYVVSGLTPNTVWCFGVRAQDTNDLLELNETMRAAGPVSGAGDNDADCLENGLEVTIGTEPCLKDTDEDGMWDGWEYTFSTNNPSHTNALAMDPLDNGTDKVRTPTAGDGDASQLADVDLDGDGASNYEEFEWWYNRHLTNGCDVNGPTNRYSPDPTLYDTDGDLMPDGWEIFNGYDPVDPADAAGDSDGDGLTNLEEYQWGSDPDSDDSDSDGLTDGNEVANGTNPSQTDSDGDGLDDNFEYLIGSDPTDADSNDSCLGDGDTYQLGWDDPSAAITNWIIYHEEDFETATNWYHHAPNAYIPIDLWHLSQAEPAPKTNGIVYLNERSPTNAYRLAYDPTGQDTSATYNVGSVLACALESPPVDALAASTLFVGWNEYYVTEPDDDYVQVFARSAVDTNWVIVSEARSGRSGVTSPSNDARWVHRTADLTRFAGQAGVQVRFLFTAQNGINNTFAGWYVDDFKLYEGVTIDGWVRDNNGAPVEGVRVWAIGRGGVTNVNQGHRLVMPGKIMAEAVTADDGSYSIRGIPHGNYYVKALDPNYRAEFYNGALFTPPYGYGQGLNPGVYRRDDVSAAGWVDLTAAAASQSCHFELETGKGKAFTGILREDAAGNSDTVLFNGLPTTIWNGQTNTPALLTYMTSNDTMLVKNHPDWETNAVMPTYLGSLAPGRHNIYAGTNEFLYPLVDLRIREGEFTQIALRTNQGRGMLDVTAEDGGSYPVWLNGIATTSMTPARITLAAGLYRVQLEVTNALGRVAPQRAEIRYGQRTKVLFSTNAIDGDPGKLLVDTLDLQGNVVSNAEVYVNGEQVTFDEVSSATNLTPISIISLLPGNHEVVVAKEGYRPTEVQMPVIASHVTNSITFVMYEDDLDYDLVGDFTEVNGYTNVFEHSRSDDPDQDGLNNLFEFEQFRRYNVRMNVFNADTDGDGLLDGGELGYDGHTNLLAKSMVSTNIIEDSTTVRSFFVGQYLAGIDNFGDAPVAAAIECDRFLGRVVNRVNSVVPTKDKAETVYSNVPKYTNDVAVSLGHNDSAELLADGMPDRVDTDGDGMWDGFEAAYGRTTIAMLDVVQCSGTTNDPDFDGLSNYEEFLGPDGIANTNDWSDPTNGDSDGDLIPDGWEYFYGFDPNSSTDAWDDPDGDGLINLSEYFVGTNPKLTDTDADGLDDAKEVMTYGSDPLDVDTDQDGLLDGREVWDKDMDGTYDGGFFPMWQPGGDLDDDGYVDGPTDWDTDGDGMPDGFEVIDPFGNLRNPALDPYDPTDGDLDPDGDGLTSLQEYLVRDALYGNHPSDFDPTLTGVVWDYPTDPFNADTDGDGMPDGWETINGLDPVDPAPARGQMITTFGGLAVDGDADGDGMWNEREYRVRFHLDEYADEYEIDSLSTHPWNPDTDGDGLGDGEEDRAFAIHPIKQDSDNDRLMDGVNVHETFGEVETLFHTNSEYSLVYCTNLTWAAARNAAMVAHPQYPWIVGELASITTTDEMNEISLLLDATVTNVAIGGRNSGEAYDNWSWLSGEEFVFSNFFGGVPVIETGAVNYIVMDSLGSWNSITQGAAVVDHYLVEWAEIPAATNHYDEALNDLWILRWPDVSPLPYWSKREPEAHSLVPEPRWGAGISYIPVLETKNPRDDDAKPGFEGGGGATVLLDNRKLIVMGGRDGVTRQRSIWEYIVRSNVWVKSSQRLDVPLLEEGPGLLRGVSELNVFSVFGWQDTKADSCGCDNVPYNCTGEDFLEPKVRPWEGSDSFDWTIMVNGWNEEHDYYGIGLPMLGFYKSTDSQSVNEQLYVDSDATEYIGVEVIVEGTNAPVTNIAIQADYTGDDENHPRRLLGGPFVITDVEIDGGKSTYTTNTFLGTNGFYFGGLNGLGSSCEQMLKALLEIQVSFTNTQPLEIKIFAEFDPDEDMAYGNEDKIPSERVGWYYNSVTITSTVPAGLGVNEYFPIDVTEILRDAVGQDRFNDEEVGFVIYTETLTGHFIELNEGATRLNVWYKPSYAVDPYWRRPITGWDIYRTVPTPTRKSSQVVYDYIRERAVMFGGINGNDVLSDTRELEITYTAFNPKTIYWREVAIDGESPPARWGHSMIFNEEDGLVYVFGGFNADHEPLNDLWVYEYADDVSAVTTNEDTGLPETNSLPGGTWTEIDDFWDRERPPPRGGAAMAFMGGFDYDRAIGDYCCGGSQNRLVLFGGTDGRRYFNDLWVLDPDCGCSERKPRWVMVNPSGENSQGPSPRAFASMVWAQNAGMAPDQYGEGGFRRREDPPCTSGGLLLFGGRSGTLPDGRDTDLDFVDDGVEYEIGGVGAGRDPRDNALIWTTVTNEIPPYAIKTLGSETLAGTRGFVADLESLSYRDRVYAAGLDLPFQGHPLEYTVSELYRTGVDAYIEDWYDQWYHRYSIENPFDERDVWELGIPNDDVASAGSVPPYAYSGRWVYGTKLGGNYPNDAKMELYSPIFNTMVPSINSTDTNNQNSFFLIYHEWLDLADSNDWVKVDVVRPTTPADVNTRVTGLGKDPRNIIGKRNYAFNTTGQWRRVVAPLDAVANETNLYLRFTLQSDASGTAGGWYIDDIAVVQAAELYGTLSGATSGVPIQLLGVNYNGHFQDQTLTDANGYYEFGLLPYGTYLVLGEGSLFGPVSVGPGGSNQEADLVVVAIDNINYSPGNPTTLEWSAIIGMDYVIQYANTPFGPWMDLATITAATDPETYDDPAGAMSMRYYRILLNMP